MKYSKRSSASKSTANSTIVVKQDYDVDSFYLPSRSGSKSDDDEKMFYGNPNPTVIEVEECSSIEKPSKVYAVGRTS